MHVARPLGKYAVVCTSIHPDTRPVASAVVEAGSIQSRVEAERRQADSQYWRKQRGGVM